MRFFPKRLIYLLWSWAQNREGKKGSADYIVGQRGQTRPHAKASLQHGKKILLINGLLKIRNPFLIQLSLDQGKQGGRQGTEFSQEGKRIAAVPQNAWILPNLSPPKENAPVTFQKMPRNGKQRTGRPIGKARNNNSSAVMSRTRETKPNHFPIYLQKDGPRGMSQYPDFFPFRKKGIRTFTDCLRGNSHRQKGVPQVEHPRPLVTSESQRFPQLASQICPCPLGPRPRLRRCGFSLPDRGWGQQKAGVRRR